MGNEPAVKIDTALASPTKHLSAMLGASVSNVVNGQGGEVSDVAKVAGQAIVPEYDQTINKGALGFSCSPMVSASQARLNVREFSGLSTVDAQTGCKASPSEFPFALDQRRRAGCTRRAICGNRPAKAGAAQSALHGLPAILLAVFRFLTAPKAGSRTHRRRGLPAHNAKSSRSMRLSPSALISRTIKYGHASPLGNALSLGAISDDDFQHGRSADTRLLGHHDKQAKSLLAQRYAGFEFGSHNRDVTIKAVTAQQETSRGD